MDIEDLQARGEGNVAVPVSSFDFRGIREEGLKGEKRLHQVDLQASLEGIFLIND